MRAFVAMRRFLIANAQIFQRLDRLDRKQLENEQKFEKVFAKFEENEPRRQGIFYDGESYDAYTFVSDRIREASIVIVILFYQDKNNTIFQIYGANTAFYDPIEGPLCPE